MLLQALLIGLIVFIGKADYFVGTALLGRPLVLGALVGLALGDVSTGVIIGFQLELVFMGMQAIGASVPPDMIVGSVLGTAFALTTGNGIDTAITIAMPAAVLSAFVVNLFYGVITPIMARSADRFAEQDNDRGITAIFLANGFLYDVTFAIIAFVAFLFGGDAVSALVASIPAWLTTGIAIATGILPALGFAQLVTMIVSKQTAVFLLLGFLLAAYLKVPILGIVCFAIVIVGVLMMAHIFIPSQNRSLETEADDDNEF
jgi:fructoselysine and glucoselysine-specific PTS system IIC component